MAKNKYNINELEIKFPVYYNNYTQQVFDYEHNLVLDVRSWGRLQKLDNPCEKQDNIGFFISDSMNQGYLRRIRDNFDADECNKKQGEYFDKCAELRKILGEF